MINRSSNRFINFAPKHFKVFMLTFLAVFLIISLQLKNIWKVKIIFPIPQNKDIFYDEIIKKLETKQNLFKINNKHTYLPKAYAGESYENAAAYALINYENGEVILSKNLDKKLAIASITKVMTAVVALDLADEKEQFKVSNFASQVIPTKIGVKANEEMTLDELLNAALLTSANDAVEVIRENIDSKYNAKVFIKAMNEKARVLGLKNTAFSNPQGFDDVNHFSTVSDVAILTHYALDNYPTIKEIVVKDYQFLAKNRSHKQFDLLNWNGLIGVYPGAVGIKIGYTENAGRTTSVVAERGGIKLIAVVLGAPGILERDLWAADLLDSGFSSVAGLAKIALSKEDLEHKYSSWSNFN